MQKDNGLYGDPDWWKKINPLRKVKPMKEPLQDEHSHAIANAKGWLAEILAMVCALEIADEQAMDGPDETEAAQSRIYEAPLSVLVRGGWYPPGAPRDAPDRAPEEYEILLTTGGPALRLIGKLDDYNQPDEWPRLEYQDWFTPWTEYIPAREHREALQKFAAQFYYGD